MRCSRSSRNEALARVCTCERAAPSGTSSTSRGRLGDPEGTTMRSERWTASSIEPGPTQQHEREPLLFFQGRYRSLLA
jgi:hypothetical protein